MADAPRLAVVASPVDTFVRPAPPKSAQLADALQSLVQPVQKLGGTIFDKSVQDATDAATRAAAVSHAKSYADAVANGEIKAGFNPWFRKAFNEQRGFALGQEVKQRALTAYQTWDGKDSADPNAFQDFLADQIKSGLDGVTDADILRGAEPQLRILQQNLGERHAQYVADKTEQGLNESVSSTLLNSLRETNDPTNLTQFAQNIEDAKVRFKATGYSLAHLNVDTANAVFSRALESNDERYLALLKAPRADGTPAIGDIPEFALKIEQVRGEVRQNIYHAQQAEADARRAQEADFKANALSALIAKRNAEGTGFRLTSQDMDQLLLGFGDPGEALRFVNAFRNSYQTDDNSTIQAVRAAALGNPGEVTALYQTGRISADQYADFFPRAVSAAKGNRAEARAEASAARASSSRTAKLRGDSDDNNGVLVWDGRPIFVPPNVPNIQATTLTQLRRDLTSKDPLRQRGAVQLLTKLAGGPEGADWYFKIISPYRGPAYLNR